MIVDKKNLSLVKIEKTLGPLEEKILFLVDDKSSPRDILMKIKNKRYAYTTIMTIMDKLYKKGFLKREKIKKTYYYSPKFNLNKISQTTIKNLILQLNFYFHPLKFFIYFLLVEFIVLINKTWILLLKNLFLKTIFLSTTFIFLINYLIQIYLNGFFEFINLILINPSLIFNFTVLNEMISFFELMILFIFSIISLKLIVSSKNSQRLSSRYQFKLFNL